MVACSGLPSFPHGTLVEGGILLTVVCNDSPWLHDVVLVVASILLMVVGSGLPYPRESLVEEDIP